MLRSIYGLKQSVLKWYEQVCAVMADLGFTKVESDHALFYYDELDQAVNTVCTRCLMAGTETTEWLCQTHTHFWRK